MEKYSVRGLGQPVPNALELQSQNVRIRATGETANNLAKGIGIGIGFALALKALRVI